MAKLMARLNRISQGQTTKQTLKSNYDAIVVGAGPAGATAAYFMAKEGLNVLLLERGEKPGSKNVMGGAIYSVPTHHLFPNFWEEAPWERVLINHEYWLMTEDSAIKTGFLSTRFQQAPYNRFSIMRPKFDPWLAGKAVQVGAQLANSHKADSLIIESGRITGVKIEHPVSREIMADVVILAEGANGLLLQKAGLVQKPPTKNMSLYMKETLLLPKEVIDQRLNLRGDQGTVIGFIGHTTAGLIGTGSLYTYKDGIGLNVGCTLEKMQKAKISANDMLERIKNHPFVKPIIEGAQPVEYTAHLIPEAGYEGLPKLVHPGLLLVGDSAGLVNGTHGSNLAMHSGKMAADTVIIAKKKGDFSLKSLQLYDRMMKDSFIIKDLQANQDAVKLYAKKPYLFDLYSKIANDAAYEVSMVYPIPKKEKRKLIYKTILQKASLWQIIKDVISLIKAHI